MDDAGTAMRILVVTNMYPPHAYGGYELACRDVVERWRAHGHEVLVLTSTVRVPGVPGAPEDRSRVRRELRLYWDDHVIVRPSPPARLRVELANRAAFDRAVADLRPDVVSAWAMGALSLGLLSRAATRGLPVVPVLCDEWPVYGPQVDSWLRPLLRRPVLARLVRAVTGLPTSLPPLDESGPACFASEALRTGVRARSPWAFPDSAVVPLGIDRDAFAPPATVDAAARAPTSWNWRLLYVGRIDPRKGIEVAMAALAACPDEATLAIVGRGDDAYLADLRALAVRLGVAGRVSFGHAERDGLAAVYRAADVLVFPPTWDEPFGLVPIEAMACGTPVVASATGGAAEFLVDAGGAAAGTTGDAGEHGNCVLFDAGDAEGLARALARLAGDADLRARLVRGGLATADRFGADRLADSLENWHRVASARDPVASDPGRVRPLDTVASA